jgi:hypothetical protein
MRFARCDGLRRSPRVPSSRWHSASAPIRRFFRSGHALLLKPLPYAEPNRLVRLYERNPARGIEYGDLSPGTKDKNLGASHGLANSCN